MSDKSKFLEMSIEYENAKLISVNNRQKLETTYKEGSKETQDAMDKYPEKVLDQSLNIMLTKSSEKNLKSLKNNVQFMAWILIINLVGIIFYVWAVSI